MSLQDRLARVLAHRAKFPAWVNRMIDAVVDHPPKFLWKRLSPFAREALPHEIPAAPEVPLDRDERIIIGPLNYSAQGYQWARALERARPEAWVHNFSLEVPGGFSFPTDTEVPMHVHASSVAWQEAQHAALLRATHVLVEAQRPLLGRFFASFEAEARDLMHRGVSVAAIAHGTDVRVPSEHRQTTRWSVYHEKDFYAGREETLAVRSRDALRRLGIPVFVSTPDLLHFLPEAAWCPVVVDPAQWRTDAALAVAEKLIVAHAPSVARVKGTDLVEPILHRLHDEGVIEYRPIRGVPSAQMPELYRSTDIVLDQFRIGSYGVAACEAMSAGRVVLGHVTEAVRERISERTGHELPIVEATPETLEAVLRHAAAHREELQGIAAAGRQFVAEVHDGRLSAQVLAKHWLDASECSEGADE